MADIPLGRAVGSLEVTLFKLRLTLCLSGVRFVLWGATQTTSIGVKQQTSVAALRGVRRELGTPHELGHVRASFRITIRNGSPRNS